MHNEHMYFIKEVNNKTCKFLEALKSIKGKEINDDLWLESFTNLSTFWKNGILSLNAYSPFQLENV